MKIAHVVSALAVVSTSCLLSWGCSSSGSAGCDGDLEAEVSYLGGDLDGTAECATLPGECEVEEPCLDDACTAALYDLCASPYLGVACVQIEGDAAIISCNP